MKFKLREKFDKSKLYYRITRGENVESFDCTYPQFFTDNIKYAIEYADEEDSYLYTVKLNINNPFDLSTQEQIDIFNNDYIKWADSNRNIFYNANTEHGNINDDKIDEILSEKSLGDSLDFINADYVYMFFKDNTNYGFDGLVVDEGITWGELKGTNSYIPFNSNQIKIIKKERYDI